MGLGEVGDVDVVPHTGAVGGGVVLAVDGDGFAPPERDLQHDGDQVGLGVVAFAQARVGAGDVEVAQAGRTDAVHARELGQCGVDGGLGGAVGVAGADGGVLADLGGFGFAVDGGGGGEDDACDAVGAHGLQQGQRAADVAVPVALGAGHRFGHHRAGGEVQHGLDSVAGEDVGGAFADAALDEAAPSGTASRCPVDRSSRTDTSCPDSSSWAATTLPMYPAPPVTRTLNAAP